MTNVLRALRCEEAVAGVRRLCTAAKVPSLSPLSSSFAADGTPLYRRLSALGGAPAGSVTRTMNKWLREGRSVRAKAIVQYVKELRKYRRYMHALELMEWMDTRGMNMSYSNHALRLDLVSKVNGIDSAEEYFINLPEAARNELAYGTLLYIYCTEKAVDKATRLFEKMKELKYECNTLAYNHMMKLYVSTGQPEKLASLLLEMKAKKIPMNSFSYNIIITSYASTGDAESADRLVQVAKDTGFSLEWPVYSNLASMYISSGDAEKAKSSLKQLEEVMNRTDRQSYHHLISLFARMGNLDEVLRVWNTLKESMKPTNMSYLVLLRALNTLDAFGVLELCFNEWNSSYTTYDIWLVNIMIGAYLRQGKRKEAESLLDGAIMKGVEPDVRSYELFIDFYLRYRDIDLALKYFEEAILKLKGWRMNQMMVDSFLKHFEERNDSEGAERFRKKLSKLCDQDSHLSSTFAACTGADVNEFCPEDGTSNKNSDTASLLNCALAQPLY